MWYHLQTLQWRVHRSRALSTQEDGNQIQLPRLSQNTWVRFAEETIIQVHMSLEFPCSWQQQIIFPLFTPFYPTLLYTPSLENPPKPQPALRQDTGSGRRPKNLLVTYRAPSLPKKWRQIHPRPRWYRWSLHDTEQVDKNCDIQTVIQII